MKIRNFFKHLHTINKHRRIVRHICFKIGIPFRGLVHDLSKYSPSEFIPSVKYFTDGKRSPTEEERAHLGYSSCWLHHKGRNKHHMEYWYDVSLVSHEYEPVKMPIKYLKEMFADRIAASKVYKGKEYKNDAPLIYLQTKRASKLLHRESYLEMEKWLGYLADFGEKEAFKRVRKTKSY